MKEKIKYIAPRIVLNFLSIAIVSSLAANWDVFFYSKSWSEFVLMSNPKNLGVWILFAVTIAVLSWRFRHVKDFKTLFGARL